tara:strand:- start:692 stop:1300 length:609 start_codon:yes stop_codon:yes gene_type:complete
MKNTKMLNEIRTLLNLAVKLEEQKLENGTRVSAESFEKGNEIFILTDDEKVAMPVGEYLLEDGRLVVCEEEGLIADVREVSDEVPAKEEATEEDKKEETEDLEDETVETEVPAAVAPEVEAIIEAVVEVIAPVIEEVKAEIEELKKKFGDIEKEDKKKEEMSAARKPLRHNPEAKTAQREQVQMGKGKFNTTLDRVLNKLNK